MRGAASRRAWPRRSSQIQPVTPMESPSARQSSSSAGPPVKQCRTPRDASARVRAQHGEEIRLRVALVQEERLAAAVRRGRAAARMRGAARPAARSSGSSRARIRRPRRPSDRRAASASRPASPSCERRRMVRVDAGRRAQQVADAAGTARWPCPCRRACCRSRSSRRRRPRARARARRRGRRRSCRARGWRRCRPGRAVTGAAPCSGGAERRRHGLARRPQRRQEAADHADRDRDDEARPRPARA